MNENGAWNTFMKTGTVEDYLKYRDKLTGREERDSFQTTDLREDKRYHAGTGGGYGNGIEADACR